MQYKGIIHFHSEYSYDSILSIKKIVQFAQKYQFNFLILTDHDTVRGAQALRNWVKEHNLDIEVPLAAEYKTEYGDIIAAFINDEITFNNFSDLIKKVKEQNGLILLPHPYNGHDEIDLLAQNADMIEVKNSRCRNSDNHRASELSQVYSNLTYIASDAHFAISLNNGIIEFDQCGDLKQSLLSNTNVSYTWHKTNPVYQIASQYIKSFKTRSIKTFLTQTFLLILAVYKNLKNLFEIR